MGNTVGLESKADVFARQKVCLHEDFFMNVSTLPGQHEKLSDHFAYFSKPETQPRLKSKTVNCGKTAFSKSRVSALANAVPNHIKYDIFVPLPAI